MTAALNGRNRLMKPTDHLDLLLVEQAHDGVDPQVAQLIMKLHDLHLRLQVHLASRPSASRSFRLPVLRHHDCGRLEGRRSGSGSRN